MSVSLLRQVSPSHVVRVARQAQALRPLATRLPAVFRQFDDMLKPFDSFFNSPVPSAFDTPFFQSQFVQPSFGSVDVSENETSHTIVADTPGLRSEDVRVCIRDGNVLEMSGERKRETEEGTKGSNFYRMERSYGKFTRRFQLPESADTSNISAEVKDGVLKIVVGKKEPSKLQPNVQEIPVKMIASDSAGATEVTNGNGNGTATQATS